jgi:esterase/lipase
MGEQNLRLDGPDGNGIYGALNANGNRRLIVHIHGLTHHARHLLEVTSSAFFGNNGYDHYRMSLYERGRDSRKLPDSTLTTHKRDIETILDHFRPLYDEIFISAHSLGGLVTLILNPAGVKAISLWDPAMDATNFWASGPYLTPMPERRQYQLDYGNVFVLGEAMVDEIKQYPDEICLKLAKAVSTPTQIVIPEESIFLASPHTSPENYRDAFGGPFDLQRMEGANHTFSKQENRQELFARVLGWFDRFSGG